MNLPPVIRGLIVIFLGLGAAGVGQVPAVADDPLGGRGEDGYIAAVDLLPDSTAGLLRVPDFPSFCTGWDETNLGKLLKDPLLEPFVESQRERSRKYFESIDSKVGLRPADLYDIASGEVVAAWLPFERDKRRPYAVCVIADSRGMRQQVDAMLDKIDADLRSQGATRKDVEHGDQIVRVYTREPKPGQLKIEEIVITADDTRVIAADRDTVVFDLLDAAGGSPKGPPLRGVESFLTVMARSHDSLQKDLGDGLIGLQWFARPFAMGRILREVFEVDRGTQVDILKLLENQGFDAIRAAGGAVGLGVGEFDFLHRGVVLAPPTADEPDRYELGARMLQFPNIDLGDLPGWIAPDLASVLRVNWRMEPAFWAAETVVNEAFGEDIFRPTLRDIRDDQEGPQIDIVEDVLPNLDDHAIMVTDNTLPAGLDSERMLVAIRVKDGDKIREVVARTMEVEPDVTILDAIPGVDIWVVDRDQTDIDFGSDLFVDLGIDDDIEADKPPPLLEHWAIAQVDRGPDGRESYLMFSSHPDLLIETAKRILEDNGRAPPPAGEFAAAGQALRSLGAGPVAVERVVRPGLSLRVKYELFRKGELQDIDSIGASLLRRLFRAAEVTDPEPVEAEKLPPMSQIEHYFRPAGSFVETTDDGWTLNSFILK